MGRSTALLEPLADHIGKLARTGPTLFADDTPVKMQIGGKTGRTQTARMWSYVRDERPWCGQVPPCAWYQFSVDRKGRHPATHLRGYTGIVHADGFTGFNGLFGEGLATEQACMAHVRRKFVDVFERDGSTIARETIERIARLYAVEKDARYKPPGERGALRRTRAKPIFDELGIWLKQQLPKMSGKTSLAEAVRYVLGRMPKARAYLEDDKLTKAGQPRGLTKPWGCPVDQIRRAANRCRRLGPAGPDPGRARLGRRGRSMSGPDLS